MKLQKYAFGYCRVSTKMQVDDGLSLDTQKEKMVSYCQYKNLNLV
jgi:DNA invertase Pin-like site-specific DNA recombinase